MDNMFPFSDGQYQTVLLIGIVLGLFFGIFMSRESDRRQKVRGGLPAEVFNYLGSSSVSGILPMVIAGLVSGFHFLQLLGMGLMFLASTAIFMLSYGFFESQVAPLTDAKPARELD